MTKHLMIIRDPIHNYIPISELEAGLIGDPLFQRLRYVSQNPLAHFVYPSNRTSRFVHSLGTMHLSGKFLLHGIANSTPQHLLGFWQAISELLRAAEAPTSAKPERMEKYLREANDPFYRESGVDTLNEITLLQSLRLASVMHDLGHFPFSHTAEHVLFDAFLSSQGKRQSTQMADFASITQTLFRKYGGGGQPGDLHEAIGRALMEFIFKGFPEQGREFATYCFWIAQEIARPGRFLREDPSGIVQCLHSIVCGNLDADRCDYVRRDGYASGFEFGDYDIQRILSTIRFTRNPERDNKFDLVATTVAISALESLFLERYRIYKWLVFHPMVVRLNVALARALAILLEIFFREETGGEAETILKLLEGMEFNRMWKCLESEKSYDGFALCDENWLLTLLRRIQLTLSGKERLPIKQLALRVYLDLVCDRKKEHLSPLWKRQEDYREFAQNVAENLAAQPNFPTEIERRKGSTEDDVAWCNRVMETILGNDIETKGHIATMRQFERQIQTRLEGYAWWGGIIAAVLPFTPYQQVQVLDTSAGNRLMYLEDLSMIVRGLEDMWRHEIRLRPFWWAREEIDGGFRLGRSDMSPPALPIFAKAFVETLLAWRSPS